MTASWQEFNRNKQLKQLKNRKFHTFFEKNPEILAYSKKSPYLCEKFRVKNFV